MEDKSSLQLPAWRTLDEMIADLQALYERRIGEGCAPGVALTSVAAYIAMRRDDISAPLLTISLAELLVPAAREGEAN